MEKEIHVKVGKTFEISLPEISSTGYQWAVGHMPDKSVDLVNTEYKEPEEEELKVGKTGTRIVTFAAMAPGKDYLKLDYVRLWELPNIAESKEYPLVVES